jgi:hypothetical protein
MGKMPMPREDMGGTPMLPSGKMPMIPFDLVKVFGYRIGGEPI